jgi:hypothetical protein
MVLFVPAGDPNDLTRTPGSFDSTAQFLLQCGAQRLDNAADMSRIVNHEYMGSKVDPKA